MPHRHTRSSRTTRILLLLAAVLVSGCRTAAIYVPDVKMQLAIQPDEVRAGDTLQLEFTLVNPRPDTVVLEFGEDCRVSVLVADETNSPGAAPRCIAPGEGRLALPAGGTWTARGAWVAVTEDGRPAPAGAYRVRAILGEHDSMTRGRSSFKLGHSTDTIPFRVVPAR